MTQQSLLDQFDRLSRLVGNTPLHRFSSLESDNGVEIHAKLEWLQWGGSVKMRPAFNLMHEAVRRGELHEGVSLLDSTSGNTGIAYASIAAKTGLRATIVMKESVTKERIALLRSLGAELILADESMSSDEVFDYTQNMAQENPDKYFYANQYDNDDNWKAHFNTTGPEIIRQTDERITHYCAGLGTCGSFMGTGRKLKQVNPAIQLVGMHIAEQDNEVEGWKYLAASRHPGIYVADFADDNISVSTEEAFTMVKTVARQEGWIISPSSAAALVGAQKVAHQLENGVVVTVLPDDGSKYGEILERIFGE